MLPIAKFAWEKLEFLLAPSQEREKQQQVCPCSEDADWYLLLEPSNVSIACVCLPGKRLAPYGVNKDSSAVSASRNGSEVSWSGLCCAGAGAAVQCGCDLQQVPVAPRGAASRTLCCKGS